MRTSLDEIRNIDDYLFGKASHENLLLMKARLIVEPVLRFNVVVQEKVYLLVRAYGRKILKEEVGKIHEELFQDPEKSGFQNEIYSIFLKD